MEQGLKANALVGIRSENEFDAIIDLLKIPEIPLLEKNNLLLFYQYWRSGNNLIEVSEKIQHECAEFVKTENKRKRYGQKLSHFKFDLKAQLLRECGISQKYIGLDNIIAMSWGLPRNLLVILKQIYAWAVFNGETPFRGTPISIESQMRGVLEASEWFLNDAKLGGEDGTLVQKAISKLGTLFRSVRFSDKPSECSLSTFSCNLTSLTSESRRIIDLATNRSLLVKVGRQRDRNSKRIDTKFQLNRMLAPLWDLPLSRRGIIALQPHEVDSIFDVNCSQTFTEMIDRRISRMTAPFFGKRKYGKMKENEFNNMLPGIGD